MPLVFAVLLIIVLWTSGVKNIKQSKENNETEDWNHRKTNARQENLFACEYFYSVDGATIKQAIEYSHRKIRDLGFVPCLQERHYVTQNMMFMDENIWYNLPEEKRLGWHKCLLLHDSDVYLANSDSVRKRIGNIKSIYYLRNIPIPKSHAIFGGIDLGEYEDFSDDNVYENWPTSWWTWLDEDSKGSLSPFGRKPIEFKCGDSVVHKRLGYCKIINVRFSNDYKHVFYTVEVEETGKITVVDGDKKELEKL